MEHVYEVIEAVLDEVIELFPSPLDLMSAAEMSLWAQSEGSPSYLCGGGLIESGAVADRRSPAGVLSEAHRGFPAQPAASACSPWHQALHARAPSGTAQPALVGHHVCVHVPARLHAGAGPGSTIADVIATPFMHPGSRLPDSASTRSASSSSRCPTALSDEQAARAPWGPSGRWDRLSDRALREQAPRARHLPGCSPVAERPCTPRAMRDFDDFSSGVGRTATAIGVARCRDGTGGAALGVPTSRPEDG